LSKLLAPVSGLSINSLRPVILFSIILHHKEWVGGNLLQLTVPRDLGGAGSSMNDGASKPLALAELHPYNPLTGIMLAALFRSTARKFPTLVWRSEHRKVSSFKLQRASLHHAVMQGASPAPVFVESGSMSIPASPEELRSHRK
jgi:hypothetical protein